MHLQSEVLSLVFSKLSSLKDLVRCAVVSKSWEAAIAKVQPQELRIRPYGSGEDEPSISLSQLRCLQRLQQQQRPQDVRTRVSYLRVSLSPFLEGLLVLPGCWNLRECVVEGPFSLDVAVAVLPSDLVSLTMIADTPPLALSLSAFHRFTKLETLNINFSGCQNPPGYVRVGLDCKLPSWQLKC